MNRFFRVVGNLVWAFAFGLSVALAFELHEYKFDGWIDIALGVALLSLVLSALGLLLARVAGKQGDRLGMRIGIVIWMTGAISFGLTELGYWYGSYKDRHAEYVQVKTTKERQAGLKDMAWDALKTGEVRTTAAELTSRMKAARQSELWSSSGGCEKTTPKSRAFCQGYFEFEAALAKANKLETIEAEFLAEKPEATRKTAHSVFTTADLLAENTGMSERTASVVVILVIALVLMLSRDLLPIVANPIGRATGARTRPEDDLGVIVVRGSVTAPPASVEPKLDTHEVRTTEHSEKFAETNTAWASEEELQKLRDLVAEMKAAETTLSKPENVAPQQIGQISPNSDPTGPGTPVAKPEPAEVAEEVAETNVAQFPLKPRHDTQAEWRIKPKRQHGDIALWIRENIGFDKSRGEEIDLDVVYDDYVDWCGEAFSAAGKRAVSSKLGRVFKLPSSREPGARTNKARKLKGVYLKAKLATQQRRRVAA